MQPKYCNGSAAQRAYDIKTVKQNSDLDRLLVASVINRQFRHLLLTNPAAAVKQGYRGETFQLTKNELEMLRSIQSTSLCDFASQILAHLLERKSGKTTVELAQEKQMISEQIKVRTSAF